jgi:hypothetical protein
MKLTRRQILLIVWFLSLLIAGIIIGKYTNSFELGLATSLSILGVSLGVPLMRAFTEFSK